MALLHVGPCGIVGVNRDLSSHELRNEAWTDARNVRFLDGLAYQFNGHGEVYTGAPVIPYHVMPIDVAGVRYWLYAGLGKIYCVTGSGGTVVHTDLTRQTAGVDVDYTGAANAWTSTSLSGIPVLNPGNTTDPPQFWDLNTAHDFAALTGWPANTFCKSMRAHRNHLIAINITKAGVNYPNMVKWSHPAVPGAITVAGDWDETDETLDAGEQDIAEGVGALIDGLPLDDAMILYKAGSAHRMDYVGGAFIWAFRKILGQAGALNRNCIVELNGAHAVLTGDDVIAHNGAANSAQSVLDKSTRRTLFQMMDAQATDRSFVFKNPFLNEVFVCFAEAGETIPNLALVWNYKDNTVTFREIPGVHHAACGPVETGLSQPWDGDASPWSSDITAWNAAEFTPDLSRALMASNDQKLFLLDSSTTFDGSIPEAYLERRGLSLGADEKLKTVKRIRPRFSATPARRCGCWSGPETTPTPTRPMPTR
jgi:hypothetical protein